jgi:hypothetical protein
MSQSVRVLVAAAAFSLVGALSAWAEEPAPIAFGPGEQATYRISFLGVGAGTAQITVGAPTQQWGREVWPIVSSAKSDPLFVMYPIKDKFVSYWEPVSRRTIGSELFAEENRKRRRQRIKIDHAENKAYVEKQREGGEQEQETHDVQAGTSDMATATFMLRNFDLTVGKTYEQPVFTGARTFMLKGIVESREKLKLNGVERDVYKVRVQTSFTGKLESKRDMFAYFTTDPAHLPVRIEAEFLVGKIAADLVEFKAGRQLAVGAPVEAAAADATGSAGF